MFGIGSHLDAVRSTKSRLIFCFGHCWVTLAVLVTVPFSTRVWALPVLFRLYRNKKECLKHDAIYRKKTELARELPTSAKSGVRGGRPSKRGKHLAKPEAIAADESRPWQTWQ